MSQEASTRLIIPEASEEVITNESWSVETYAEGLMDELFSGIDHILNTRQTLPKETPPNGRLQISEAEHQFFIRVPTDGGSLEPDYLTTVVPPEYVSVETMTMPRVVSPETPSQSLQGVAQVSNQRLNQVVVDTPAVNQPERKQRRKSRHFLGTILIVGGTLSVAIALFGWALNFGLLNNLIFKSKQQALTQPQSQLPTATDVEADFVDYMLKALEILDKEEGKNNQKSAAPVITPSSPVAVMNQPPVNLPPVLAANNSQPNSNPSTSFVERIYIPVYQAPPPMRYAPSSPISGVVNPLPPVMPTMKAPQPSPLKTTLTHEKKAGRSVSITALTTLHPKLKPVTIQQNAPITVKQSQLPVLLPKLPAAKAPVSQATSLPKQPVIEEVASAPVVTTPSHVLEGLLELGDKSAALFKIDGITHRIQIGESIGSSGWTLVDVAKGEAIIRRNGEVRSIYAGQQL